MSEELNNMEDFQINDEVKNDMDVIDPLEQLVNHDFLSDGEINLDESYEIISLLERESKSAKEQESEIIIENLADKYVDQEYKIKLDKSIQNVKSFLIKYNVENTDVQNMSEDEKTKLFALSSFMLKNVSALLNDLLFGITLTRDEYKFISTAVERKLSYDGNEVFNIIDLNENYLKQWKQVDNSLPKQVNSMVVNIDIKNVVMLYHFLGKHTVKGLDKEFYVFASVLQKIADTNRLYNAYNIIKDRLNNDFNLWLSALDQIQEQIDTVKGVIPEK